jgi:DNA helicase-2/ATP-dependent DNA helicase PcrA
LKRIINVPGRGIGKTTLERLDQYHAITEPPLTYWEVLERAASDPSITSAATAKKINQFVQLVRRLITEQPKLLVSEIYHLILDETGYVRDLREEGTEESMARIENLEEFDSILQEFEEEKLENIPENEKALRKAELLSLFIEQSTLASDTDSLEGQTSTVKLMTLHSSKGLEFPVVFLVGMEEGLFPSIKPWEETPEEDVEEERRLCYVGMTRAREVLYMLNVVIRRIWGNVSYQEPSRFFAEVPDEFIEFKDFSYGARAMEYRTGSSRQFGYSNSRPALQLVANSQSNSSYHSSQDEWIGRQMIHPEYGRGTVVASEGMGADQKVVIQFVGQSQRKFLLRYVAGFFGNQ